MTREEEIKAEAAAEGRDPGSRRVVWVLALLAVIALLATAAVVAIGWKDSREEADAGQTLAQRVLAECSDNLPDSRDLEDLCKSATEVARGEAGPIGPQGQEGPPGVQGPQGIQGPQGAPGETGPRGPPGPKGDTGDTGRAGAAGAAGEDGSRGATGAAGPQGPAGPAGPQGATGPQGPAGESAFPFTFRFTVPSDIPGQDGTTYIVNCTQSGCTVNQEEGTN